VCGVDRQLEKSATALICLLAALLLWALPAQADSLGSKLYFPADAGVCSTRAAAEVFCTESQLSLHQSYRASEYLVPTSHGVITQWRIASGPASPATESVQLRLRLLRGQDPVPGAATAFRQLPLAEPGIHRFASRLPIEWNNRLALDVAVRGNGSGAASAPIAHSAPSIGEVGEWIPPLGNAPRLQPYRLADTDLLVKAQVEWDLDEDGFGDASQDRCRYDPRRQGPCLKNTRPPRVEVRYAKRQNFLRNGIVRVKARSDELGKVWVAGTLETPSSQTSWIGISSDGWVKPGQWADLSLYFEPRARAAARKELEGGGHPYIHAEASAYDTSGNEAKGRRVLVRLPGR
jgi:hypothetical protein